MSKGQWKNPPPGSPAARRAAEKAVSKANRETAAKLSEMDIPMANETVETPALDKLAEAVQQMAAMQKQQVEMMLLMQKQIAQVAVRPEIRPESRVEARTRVKEREPEGVRDRDGNILVRRSFESIDPMELPPEFVAAVQAENYSLEWKSEYIYNQQQTTYLSKLMNNGKWSPVLNSRIPGRYPGEPDEPIRHEGMMLMERPVGLTQQARAEEFSKARDQVNMRQRNWGVSSKKPDYFDAHTAEAEKHTILRKTLETSNPAWQPDLQIASDEDL